MKMSVLKFIMLSGLLFTYSGALDEPTSRWIPDGIIKSGEYSHILNLLPDRLVLFYMIDSAYIYFGIESKNSGWSAIGFDPERGMKNADMLIIFVENSMVRVVDAYSTGIYGPHKSDVELGGKDNVLDLKGRVDSTGYVVEFKRLLDTKDRFDKSIIRGELNLIYAMANSHNIKKKHNVAKGKVKVKFGD